MTIIQIVAGVLGLLALIAAGIYFWGPTQFEFSAETELNASPQEAFAAFTNFDHWIELWDLKSITPPEEPVGVGTNIHWIEKDSKATEVNATVTAYEPGKLFAMDMAFGETMNGSFSFSLTPTENGSYARLENNNHISKDAPGIKIMMGFMNGIGALNKYYSVITKRLKKIVEA